MLTELTIATARAEGRTRYTSGGPQANPTNGGMVNGSLPTSLSCSRKSFAARIATPTPIRGAGKRGEILVVMQAATIARKPNTTGAN